MKIIKKNLVKNQFRKNKKVKVDRFNCNKWLNKNDKCNNSSSKENKNNFKTHTKEIKIFHNFSIISQVSLISVPRAISKHSSRNKDWINLLIVCSVASKIFSVEWIISISLEEIAEIQMKTKLERTIISILLLQLWQIPETGMWLEEFVDELLKELLRPLKECP